MLLLQMPPAPAPSHSVPANAWPTHHHVEQHAAASPPAAGKPAVRDGPKAIAAAAAGAAACEHSSPVQTPAAAAVAILPQQQPGSSSSSSSMLPVKHVARLPFNYSPEALAMVKQGAAAVAMVNAKALVLGVMGSAGAEWAVVAVPYTAACTGAVLCELDANGG